jgi:succinoglycan biosynthesis protein ExoM
VFETTDPPPTPGPDPQSRVEEPLDARMTGHSAASPRTTAADAAAPAPRLAVCVAAYRRPRMLRALLGSLSELRFPDPPPLLEVIVVDNGGEVTVRSPVEEARQHLPFPVHYLVEPVRNIALARNRGVAEALRRGADWIAFVDDDETVASDWLERLLATQARYAADVVAGTVRWRLSERAPRWISEGRFFETADLPTGQPVTIAFTNNVLVRASLLAGERGPFREEFGRSGGSDSQLFMRLHRQGARMVWDSEARVEERVPESRSTAAWVLRRAFRVGNAAYRCERSLGPLGRPVTRLAKGAARLGAGAALALPSLALGPARVMRALWNVSYGMGILAAAAGYRYVEYRALHGE